jgi:hypothetical protein
LGKDPDDSNDRSSCSLLIFSATDSAKDGFIFPPLSEVFLSVIRPSHVPLSAR